MKRAKRIRWIGAIALIAIIVITIIAAPSNNQLSSGSTYNRAPEGYGAWYSFMQQQKTPVQRWRKPFSDLEKIAGTITLLRVNTQLNKFGLNRQEQEWIEKGNNLVILGRWGKVTQADFSTRQQSEVGRIKIDTTRRVQPNKKEMLLGDRFGAIVWQENFGKGQAIYSTAPYLAANAYQDYPNNYKYLAQLVSQSNKPIWVDEYIHGYKDKDESVPVAERDWVTYLIQKPIFPALLQAGIVLLVLIWGNRRFGQPISLDAPIVDNSAAYIEALAGVLQKAECSDFVLDMVGSSEQMQLQKALGLGQIPVDPQILIQAWAKQTGREPAQLEQLLKLQSQKRYRSDKGLLTWLRKWQTIRSYVKPV